MGPMSLPGLERLMEVCQRLNLGMKISPPGREPLKAGDLLEGLPFDPILTAVYTRLGHAAFASKVMGWVLSRSNDDAHDLQSINKRWRERWWEKLGEPVIVFGGEMGMAYDYATVPGLADAWGRQPVVHIDTYEFEPYVMPVASNVDRFFDTYSHFLECLVADPYYQETGETNRTFPWNATDILARDERLVELMRAGRFDALMKNVDDETRRWAARVMRTPV